MIEEIELQRSKILLEGTTEGGCVALFLPGISGKAFSERFQPLVNVVRECDLPIVRVDGWKDADDVSTKTLSYFHEMLDEICAYLTERGYTEIVAVGKSFGGGLFLSYHNDLIIKKILWAPAIGATEEGTFSMYKDTKLSEVAQLLDITLAKQYIAKDSASIHIIHGTADDVIPFANSQMIIDSAGAGAVTEIPGADHSFKTLQEEEVLMAETKRILGV